jgi:hypothetical protein
MKLKRELGKVGDFDIHIIDESQKRVASLLRNTDKHGYTMFVHIEVKDYKPTEYGTYPEAMKGLEKLLIKSGYVD